MEPDDIGRVQQVELDAGERFRLLPDPRVSGCADHPPFPAGELRAFAKAGRAWVVTENDAVVGVALVESIGGCAHIEELAVARAHGCRGLASSLIDTIGHWATRQGLAALTLTTFRDVPWNRPSYERRGFRVLGPDEITDGLRAKMAEEERLGLPADLRVAMRRELASDSLAQRLHR